MVLVDRIALTQASWPVLVVDFLDEPGRTFSVIPAANRAIDNVSILNTGFSELADKPDKDGIFEICRKLETDA
jgi:hypothetical protein